MIILFINKFKALEMHLLYRQKYLVENWPLLKVCKKLHLETQVKYFPRPR